MVAVVVAPLLLVSVGCSSGQIVQGPSPGSSAARSAACASFTPDATRSVITAFLTAYNAGAPDVTDRYIAPVGQFQWYGSPDRPFPESPASTDRSSLPTYFADQHSKGDRLELKDFSWNSAQYYADIHGWAVNFGYTLIHTIAGANPHAAPGKGALSCSSGKIMVWLIESW